MKQLVDCVGMSARKKVLESGRKPRVVGIWSLSGKSGVMRGEGTGKSSYKELRFDPLATPIPRPDYSALGPSSETGSVATTRSHRNNSNDSHNSSNGDQRNNQPRTYLYNYASSEGTNTDSEDGLGGPPSPSPSPRPGSAMSMMSMSRRSGTPTTTTMLTMSGSMNNLTATGTLSSHRSRGNNSVAGTSNLSIPSATSAGALNLDFKLGLPPGNAAAATDGRKATTLAVPSARRHSNPEPRSQSESFPVLQNGNEQKPTHEHDESGCNTSYLTEFEDQWDELEMRHAAMMEDIEDLEERFQGLNASLMDGS